MEAGSLMFFNFLIDALGICTLYCLVIMYNIWPNPTTEVKAAFAIYFGFRLNFNGEIGLWVSSSKLS